MTLSLILSAKGERRVSRDESVCVDSSYSTGNPVKVDVVGGEVDIYQTQPQEL